MTTAAHERFAVKVVVRHGFFAKFICFGIFRSGPTAFFKVFSTIRNRGKNIFNVFFFISFNSGDETRTLKSNKLTAGCT